MWIAVWITAVTVAAIGVGSALLNGSVGNSAGTVEVTFVGSDTCAGCHRTEANLWRGSQHRLAMQHATETSVLGDFHNASFDYYGIHSRFF
jgi:cytochrome c553